MQPRHFPLIELPLTEDDRGRVRKPPAHLVLQPEHHLAVALSAARRVETRLQDQHCVVVRPRRAQPAAQQPAQVLPLDEFRDVQEPAPKLAHRLPVACPQFQRLRARAKQLEVGALRAHRHPLPSDAARDPALPRRLGRHDDEIDFFRRPRPRRRNAVRLEHGVVDVRAVGRAGDLLRHAEMQVQIRPAQPLRFQQIGRKLFHAPRRAPFRQVPQLDLHAQPAQLRHDRPHHPVVARDALERTRHAPAASRPGRAPAEQ